MNEENDDEFVSRSQKKREVEALQKLGAALVALAPAQLEGAGLPDDLLAAVRDAQRITSHEAASKSTLFCFMLSSPCRWRQIKTNLRGTQGANFAAPASACARRESRIALRALPDYIAVFAAVNRLYV